MIPLERYPGLPPLFLDFARGESRFHPDPPDLDAAIVRGRELLARGAGRLPASAFRYRGPAGQRAAEELASGRAAAVIAGHQIGLFTGPLFTLGKALDAIAISRELRARGLPAVPVFWALTDDHDLEEIARTAKPGPEGPERFVLEGADRSNRRPVGTLPVPEGVAGIVDAFRREASGPDASGTLEKLAARYSPGRTYGEAFVEALFDLVEEDALLVVDPLGPEIAAEARRFFLAAIGRRSEIAEALERTAAEIERAGRAAPVPVRSDVFPFFAVEDGVRRRVDASRLEDVARRVEQGRAEISADVLTRPVLKSLVLPAAVSVLGPSEIAYHAQSLPLFPMFEARRPVLVSRTLLVLRGPAERRAAEALGLPEESLLSPGVLAREGGTVPEAARISGIAGRLESELDALAPEVARLDPTLGGALETARRKATYQIEQLAERVRKSAERKDEVAFNRRRRLETMLLPGGVPAERVYPPLVYELAWGRAFLDAIRSVAGTGGRFVSVVDVEVAAGAEARSGRAG